MRMTKCSILAATITSLAAGVAHADVTLSILIDTNPETIASFDVVSKAYIEKHPDVSFDVEQRAGGSEGDNIIKTRLATGEMADIFQYNGGSLFQALKPQDTLADLSDLPSQAGILDSFKKVVTSPDGHVRGTPFGPAMGGGIFYNRKIYAELGLTPPKTWAEFMANNEKIKAAGKVAVARTYGTTWTSRSSSSPTTTTSRQRFQILPPTTPPTSSNMPIRQPPHAVSSTLKRLQKPVCLTLTSAPRRLTTACEWWQPVRRPTIPT